MGRDFRGSEYYRRTWFSKRTVKDGEAMVLWSHGGKMKEIVGPARVHTKFSTIRFLERIAADPFEYLRVSHRNGSVVHLRGPRALWINPVTHTNVVVEKATHLTSASDAIVVYVTAVGEEATPLPEYSSAQDGGAVKETAATMAQERAPAQRLRRVVVRGPTVFCPQFGERVHEFQWSDFESDASTRTSNASFTTLRLAPTQLSLRAPITAADGGCATVLLRVGYVVTDVEALLDGCSDLPEALATSLQSDLMALGRALDAESLRNLRGLAERLEQASEDVLRSATAALPCLAARCAQLGIHLRSVELRSVTPEPSLAQRWLAADACAKAVASEADQRRDAAIRAQIATEREADHARRADSDHAARLEAAKREAELDGLRAQAEGDRATREHCASMDDTRRALERLAVEADLATAMLSADLAKAELERDSNAHALRNEHDEQIRFLAALKNDAGVDTSRVLQQGNARAPNNTPTSALNALEALLSAKLFTSLSIDAPPVAQA